MGIGVQIVGGWRVVLGRTCSQHMCEGSGLEKRIMASISSNVSLGTLSFTTVQ